MNNASRTTEHPEDSPAQHSLTPQPPPAPAHRLNASTSSGSSGWCLANLVPLVITLMNGIGWIVVYFLVLSPQAAQNRAQEKLDDTNRRFIELQISRLEGATARLEDQLSNLRVCTQAANELNSIQQALRPNVVFGEFEFTFARPDEADLEHEIRNIGSYAALISAPTLRLSLRRINENTSSDALLVANSDYVLETYSPGMFQPGQYRRVEYAIKLLNQTLRGVTIHYAIQWQALTDPSAVSTVARILGKQITSTELKELAQFTQILTGTISFKEIGD